MDAYPYIIISEGSIQGAYTWRFEKLAEAESEARKLCLEHNVKFEVFRLVKSIELIIKEVSA